MYYCVCARDRVFYFEFALCDVAIANSQCEYSLKVLLCNKYIVWREFSRSFWPQFFFICWTALHLGEFQSAAIGQKIKIEPEPKLRKIITLYKRYFVERILIRLELNVSPNHQLICNNYHSNGFYQFFMHATSQIIT